ncbi:MAG: tripartite tricarboxylate transporter permease [Acetobacteraceae bacterium]|nr:tripartite tricarboxylate transporter permease [Acetobacteraceae bacterium]
MRGFDFLVAVIGLFGISEVLIAVEEGLKFEGAKARIDPGVVFRVWKELPRYSAIALRSSVIGCWMGVTPAGATPASFMSYGMARKLSKDGASFGTGRIEGVVAPEVANNAAGVAALLPMLALGVPGSPTAAVLLGGLIMWGLQPGPMLFVEQRDFVWGLIASMYLGNIAAFLVVLTLVPLFAAILRIPFAIIAPLILIACAIGAYTVNNAMFDVVLMLVFGLVGYVMKKLDYPLAPMVLALVLGNRTEQAFRQSLLLSEGSLAVFFHGWLSGIIMTGGSRPARLAADRAADGGSFARAWREGARLIPLRVVSVTRDGGRLPWSRRSRERVPNGRAIDRGSRRDRPHRRLQRREPVRPGASAECREARRAPGRARRLCRAQPPVRAGDLRCADEKAHARADGGARAPPAALCGALRADPPHPRQARAHAARPQASRCSAATARHTW